MLELVDKTHLNCVVHCGRESSSLSWATKFVSTTIYNKIGNFSHETNC